MDASEGREFAGGGPAATRRLSARSFSGIPTRPSPDRPERRHLETRPVCRPGAVFASIGTDT